MGASPELQRPRVRGRLDLFDLHAAKTWWWSAGTSLSELGGWSNIHLSYGVGRRWSSTAPESTRPHVGYQLYVLAHEVREGNASTARPNRRSLQDEFDASLSLRNRGSLDLSGSYSHYLHDASKYRLVPRRTRTWLWRGISRCTAPSPDASVALRCGNATDTEVITRQHQWPPATSTTARFGISYRFGSIFNVVNQRLENPAALHKDLS